MRAKNLKVTRSISGKLVFGITIVKCMKVNFQISGQPSLIVKEWKAKWIGAGPKVEPRSPKGFFHGCKGGG